MKALITGASSGLGRDMAMVLSEMGYDIIAVARRKELLEELKANLKTDVEILVCDVSSREEAKKLIEKAKEADVFINNAGFGVFGDFSSTDLESELKMIDTNITAVHILTKGVMEEFKKRGSGHILNVASIAAFFPGPLFASYYATKAYVLRLSEAISEELRREKSKVKISVLCPGPVNTEFGEVAKVSFGTGKEKIAKFVVLKSRAVAEYAVKKMLKGKEIIIPGKLMKISVFLRHFLSDKVLARVLYFLQSKKCIKK